MYCITTKVQVWATRDRTIAPSYLADLSLTNKIYPNVIILTLFSIPFGEMKVAMIGEKLVDMQMRDSSIQRKIATSFDLAY